MLRGVTRPEEAQALGLSRRLMVRVGALLKKKIEITPAVLEGAKPGTPLETALLEQNVLDKSDTLSESTLNQFPGLHNLAIAAGPDDIRVLCLQEELDVADAWGDAPAAAAPVVAQPLAVVQPAGLVPASSGNDGGALFSRAEIDRVRLKLVTAASSNDRMEALRILVHTPLTMAEKAETIFAALEDRDVAVRMEGAHLLTLLGAESGLGEQLQNLSQGDERSRLRMAEELAKRLRLQNAPALEVGAIGVCALSALKSEGPTVLAAALLDLLSYTTPAFINVQARAKELFRVSLDKLARASEQGQSFSSLSRIFVPLQKLHRAMSEQAPEMMRQLFIEERTRTSVPSVEAFILQMLLEVTPYGHPQEAEILLLCAKFLARDTQEGRDSRSVGVALAQRGAAGITPLVEVFPQATSAAQKYMLRLFEDIARFHANDEKTHDADIKPEDLERAAGTVRVALESGSRGLRMAAMGLRFIANPRIQEATRTRLAESILGHLDDFGFETDREHAEDVIAQMGIPAVEPLTRRLVPERPTPERVIAIRVLGNLALELRPLRGEMGRYSDAVTELIRKLKEISLESDFKHREVLFTAMGKLAASPAASKQAGDTVVRQLVDSIKNSVGFTTADLPDGTRQALEGLTWVAASRRSSPELIATVMGILKRIIEEAQDDLTTQERQVDGESVFEISGGNGMLDLLPQALSGMARIGRSPSTPPGTVRDLVRLLLARWQKINAGELVWGPVNGMLLVRALQEIGCESHIDDSLRMEILKGLAPRLSHPQVFQAVGRICACSDTPALAPAALTLGQGIFTLRNKDGRFDAEDRPELLKALARIAMRKNLGPPDAKGQEKARRFRDSIVEDLLQGLQDFIPGCLEAVRAFQNAKILSPEKQELIERRLKDLFAIQKY